MNIFLPCATFQDLRLLVYQKTSTVQGEGGMCLASNWSAALFQMEIIDGTSLANS